MNAILFYSPPGRLTGSTINAIEYFLAGVEHNPDLKLILLTSMRKQVLKLIYERYVLDGLDFKDNILYIPVTKLVHKKFDTVLIVDYMTINKVKGILNAKKILVISEKYTENPDYFLNKSLYNVEYYGEMPFHYRDHDYRMKCLFDRFKELKEVRHGTYVNSPKNEDIIYEDISFFKQYGLPTPYIFKSKTEPEKNLFEKFTHYFYYHADKWFDPHPRLFIECAFYLKDIVYVNPHDLRDGSWFRYNDVVNRGLEDRFLTKDYEIIRQLI